MGIRLEHFLGASFWRFSGHDPLGGEPAADPELADLAWDPPRGAGRVAGESGRLDKQDENGWMDGNLKTR